MMNTNKHSNKCRKVHKRQPGFWGKLRIRMMDRLNDHIANCPKCQRRLATVNRVELAMMLVKTQPQCVGLLARANNAALNTLKHSLRDAPQSAKLRIIKADISRFEKIRPGLERIMNTAACLFVVLMIKTGVSSSLSDYRQQGETAVHNYYARNLDGDMMGELFPNEA